MPGPLAIATVPYLNARPLVYGLAEREDVRLVEALPAALGGMLRRGEADAALAPSVAYFRLAAEGGERTRSARPGRFVALPVAAIGSRGPVASVRLVGYTPPKAVRRVRLDPASRTSNALARVILAETMGLEPHCVLPEDEAPDDRPPDAEVLMGDRALVTHPPGAAWAMDLGEAWDDLTHLPFVYAFWMARSDADAGRLTAVLSAARDAGLAAREAIAAAGAEELGLPPADVRRYLYDQVRYAFGAAERKGLTAFYRMAVAERLVPEGARLRLAEAG